MKTLRIGASAIAGTVALGGLGIGCASAADLPAPPVYQGDAQDYGPPPVEPAYPAPPPVYGYAPPPVYGYAPPPPPVVYYGYAPPVVVVGRPYYRHYPHYYRAHAYRPYFARGYGRHYHRF